MVGIRVGATAGYRNAGQDARALIVEQPLCRESRHDLLYTGVGASAAVGQYGCVGFANNIVRAAGVAA